MAVVHTIPQPLDRLVKAPRPIVPLDVIVQALQSPPDDLDQLESIVDSLRAYIIDSPLLLRI